MNMNQIKRETTIAVIEDDQDIHELLTAFFRPKGYTVKPYEDAAELLRDIKSGATFDVILTDLNLPKMSGIEFTEAAKELGVSAPIILITAQKSAETAAKAIQAGAYDFVVKPLHFPQLLVSVERAVYLRQIKTENETLKTAVAGKEGTSFDGIVVKSTGFLRAIDLAKRVANSMASVFISGETGTGKEVIARAIHHHSPRRGASFIAINCSAIPENLLESELFGHAKGSFTGAMDKKIGLFEEAAGGTLFLDEIGDLSQPLQAKLLRVLQERKIKRIGENSLRPIDVRIISATHKDLQKEVQEGRFRDDLYFRLNVIPIAIPPLRDRREDIIPLADFFLRKFSVVNGKKIAGFAKPALEYLLKRQWKGNVRELENMIERAVVLCNGPVIELEDVLFEDFESLSPLPAGIPVVPANPAPAPIPATLNSASPVSILEPGHSVFSFLDLKDEGIKSLEYLTNQYVLYALRKNRGAKDKTAKDLGIDRKTLYRRINDMEKSGFSPRAPEQ